jgi:pyridinium-3,5-bisthiocarboxylic acid mononucleotide nickel chelatase
MPASPATARAQIVHAHIDLFCGASGDMLLGALVDAGVPLEALQSTIDALGLDGLGLEAAKVDELGLSATRVSVRAPETRTHRHLPDIERIIRASRLTDTVKDAAIRVFQVLAEAEARVHDVPVDHVHFHEVGALDAIADVVGVIAGFARLGVRSVSCRALPVSHGTVECEHGLLPVPAPAVLRLMEGLPTEPLDVSGETLTPTAAALLRVLVSDWGGAPAMVVRQQGYGAGRKRFPRANVTRLILGERDQVRQTERLALLSTNVDDMNPEWLPAAMERLLSAGARDVWLTPILMKKGRPAHTLSVLAAPDDLATLREIVYTHTTSLGVREQVVERHHLARDTRQVETPWGHVGIKVATLPDGSERMAPEYEDCRRLSEAHDLPLQSVYDAALAAWRDATS